MVIPSSPQLHFMAQDFGAAAYYAIFAITATVLSGLVFGVNLSITRDIGALCCALLLIPTGLVFMVSYQFFFGVLAFKFQDTGFFWHLQSSVIAFITGTIFPLSLLPGGVISVLKLLPFTYVTYMPAMLITGGADFREGLLGILVLAAWTAAMLCIGGATYHRLRVKYDGVGA